MEINTCEKYVLAELEAAQAENGRLQSEVERLEAQLEILEGGKPRGGEPFRAHCLAVGRREVAGRAVDKWKGRDGEGGTHPFETWCREVVERSGVPECISKSAFIAEMEPELHDMWEEERDDQC